MRYYQPRVVDPYVYGLPSFNYDNPVSSTLAALTEKTAALVKEVHERPFVGGQSNNKDGEKQPFQVYAHRTEPKVAVSNFGTIWFGTSASSAVTLEGTNDLSGDGTEFSVVQNDVIYIQVSVGSLTVSSATIEKTQKDGFPLLCEFDSSGNQTRINIPLAIIEGVDADDSIRNGDFTLINGTGDGLFQLWHGGDINLEIATFLAKAAIVPTQLPSTL